jgi:hypothetical protein
MAAQEEEERVEGISADLTEFLLDDFCKRKEALRCRSMLSEKDSVVSADNGEPVKKFVVVRSVFCVRVISTAIWG